MFTQMSDDPKTSATINATTGITISSQPQRRKDTSKAYPVAAAGYEEVAQNSELFRKTLEAFHRSFGTKFSVPTIGGKALDLYRLFVEVTSRGGLEKVIRDRKWKEVIVAFNFPATITNASFVLRKFYMSLLHHYEQLYYFRRQGPPSTSLTDTPSKSPAHFDEGDAINEFPRQALQIGCLVSGTIDGKFENGYLVTVDLGCEKMQGVLYHFPQSSSVNPTRHKKRSTRRGYNFFYAEHFARLKPLHYGQDKAIGKKIKLLWSKLTEVEKQAYREKGLREKEKLRTKLSSRRSSFSSLG